MGIWIIRRGAKGKKVLACQKAMASNSFAPPFDDKDHSFEPGPVDGDFGSKTGGAAKRAKWALGYPSWLCHGRTMGWRFLAFLRKKRNLPRSYVRRRKARIAAVPEESLRGKALKHAISQIGQRESAYNVTKFTKWWWLGRSWAIGWCSIFASWCYVQAGSKTFYPCRFVSGLFTAEGYSDYSEAMLLDAINHRRGLDVVTNPEPGDLVVWQWDVGATDHTSIFEKFSGGMVVSIDGNVPDVVKRCVRSKSRVRAFIRVSR